MLASGSAEGNQVARAEVAADFEWPCSPGIKRQQAASDRTTQCLRRKSAPVTFWRRPSAQSGALARIVIGAPAEVACTVNAKPPGVGCNRQQLASLVDARGHVASQRA